MCIAPHGTLVSSAVDRLVARSVTPSTGPRIVCAGSFHLVRSTFPALTRSGGGFSSRSVDGRATRPLVFESGHRLKEEALQ